MDSVDSFGGVMACGYSPKQTLILPLGTYHDYTANTTTHVPPKHIAYYHDNKAHPHSYMRYQRHIPHVPLTVIGDELLDAQTLSDSQ